MKLAVLVPYIKVLAFGAIQIVARVVLMSERTVSLILLVFLKSECWEVSWPKILYNLRSG